MANDPAAARKDARGPASRLGRIAKDDASRAPDALFRS
jgi:hypothetical protein